MSDAPPFIGQLRARAAARCRRLVLPEGEDPRIQEAAVLAARDGLFHPVLLGRPERIHAALRATGGADTGAIHVVDPADPDRADRFGEAFQELRAARTVPRRGARWIASDPLIHGALMVRSGEVDGGVAGAVRTTGDVVVAGLWALGTAPAIRTVSSSFYMAFGAARPRGAEVLTFTDAGVVPAPSPAQSAEIAVAAASARRRIVGDEPRVAFLSYSTRGSASGDDVARVAEAVSAFRALAPDVAVDGELQADAALVPGIAERKAPGSPLHGRANVLVFPDLSSANIAYKLVQHLGGATAVGPILQGLAFPWNDLSRGATARDVLDVGCLTALLVGP